jgi:hypothetical protein
MQMLDDNKVRSLIMPLALPPMIIEAKTDKLKATPTAVAPAQAAEATPEGKVVQFIPAIHQALLDNAGAIFLCLPLLQAQVLLIIKLDSAVAPVTVLADKTGEYVY